MPDSGHDTQIPSVPNNTEVADYIALVDVPSVVDTIGSNDSQRNRTDVNLTKMAVMFAQGYTLKAIAMEFGVTADTIYNIRASDEFKAVMNSISLEVIETARTFLAVSGIRATKTLLDCLGSGNERIRMKAAIEVLDRIGLKAPEQIEVLAKSDNIEQMTDEQLFSLVQMGMREIRGKTKDEDEDIDE